MSLAQRNNTPTRPRIEPGSPDPESDALTTRPVRPWSSGFPTRSATNRAVLSQKMARGLKFRIYEVEELYYPCSENKGADRCVVTVQLICVFVFAYAKKRFSHNEAHFIVAVLMDELIFQLLCFRCNCGTPLTFHLENRIVLLLQHQLTINNDKKGSLGIWGQKGNNDRTNYQNCFTVKLFFKTDSLRRRRNKNNDFVEHTNIR